MSTKRIDAVPARLKGLRRRFERWRRTRKVRTRIADPLWASAVKVAGRYGIHRTAKALRVDYDALKKRVMIQITPQMRVVVAVEPADFRKGIDGLARLCEEALDQDPFAGWVFVFRNRKATALKILVYDGQGFWLCYKRLSSGRFPWWPASRSKAVKTLAAHQLQDYETAKTFLRAYAYLFDVLKTKDLATRRLQKILFGSSTEKTEAVIDRGTDSEVRPPDGMPWNYRAACGTTSE